MRSFKSRLMNLLLRSLGAKKMFANFAKAQNDPEKFLGAVQAARKAGDYLHEPPKKLTTKYPTERLDIPEYPCHLVKFGAKERVILFIHGGAYVLGVGRQYWGFLEKIGVGGDHHIAILDYPLAPENSCRDALASCLAAYRALVARYGAEQIMVMGDSAGAGLTMALSLKLRELGETLPSKNILLYPWLDVTMSHPEARGIEHKDYLLGVDGLIALWQALRR